MNWAGIIAAILELVGPLLAKWLKEWLDKLLNRVAARLGPLSAAGPVGREMAARELLAAARGELWWFQFARRRLLARLAETVPPAVAEGRPLLPAADALAVSQAAAACG